MRIVLLTQSYPPEPAKLASDLAGQLKAFGHEVTVLTGFPNYPVGKLYPGYGMRCFQRNTIDGVDVVRVPLYPSHDRSALHRAVNYLSFAVSAGFWAPWLIRRPDVLHVYHPPLTVGWPALWLSRLWRVPFVFEVQDLWPETLAATGMLNNRRALSIIDRLAQGIYRRASAIRVISNGFRANLVAKGVAAEKIHVISNWADMDFYRPVAPNPATATSLGLAGRFNVMFAGTIGLAQGLDTVLDAAAQVRDIPQIQYVIVGDGVECERLRNVAAERRLDNVRFLGRFPPESMSDMYALADVLLVHLRDDPLFRITIPHKVFTCMSAGRPVLAAIAGETADVVLKAGAGLTCPPSNATALAETTRQFFAMSQSQRQAMGTAGRNAIQTLYSREHNVRQLECILKQVVANHRKSRNSKPAASPGGGS